MITSKQNTPPYYHALKKCFLANSNRAFLVDYAKDIAFNAVFQLIKEQGTKTHLFVVENATIARELANLAERIIGDVKIIDGVNVLQECLLKADGLTITRKDREVPKEFKEKYPNVIFVESSEGQALLHKALSKDESLKGRYREHQSNYCVSDMLAACHYDFLVIDNIYAHLQLIDGAKNGNMKFEPHRFDKIDFYGNEYFTAQEHSWKRLKNLSASCGNCLLLSSVALNEDVANFYAALTMLTAGVKDKEFGTIAKNYNEFEDDCESVNGEIANFVEDEMVLSECLRRIAGRTQLMPRNMSEIRTFFARNFEYLSEEEAYLKTMRSFARTFGNGKMLTVKEVFDLLFSESPTLKVAACLCDMFFNDEIKNALESEIKSAKVGAMEKKELVALMTLFSRIGVWHGSTGTATRTEDCKILRLKRDNSGFEHFLKSALNKICDDDIYTYSITHKGSELLYKCVAIQRLLDGRETNASVKTPLLIVTENDESKVLQMMKKLQPAYTYTNDYTHFSLGQKNAEQVLIIHYKTLIDTAYTLQVESVVFMEAHADVTTFKNLVCKTLDWNVNAYLLASYDDISAHVTDEWEEQFFFSPIKALPIASPTFSLKGRDETLYAEVVKDTDDVYEIVKRISMGQDNVPARQWSNLINRMITRYTVDTPFADDVIAEDLAYLKELGISYNGVFENSKSIGAKGESIVKERYGYIRKTGKGKKKVIEEKVTINESRMVLFNVCQRILRRGCDLFKNDCGSCKSLQKFKTNDWCKFLEAVNGFFDKTLEYIERKQEAGVSGGGVIFGDESKEGKLVREDVLKRKKEVEEQLKEFVEEKSDGLLGIEFEKMQIVRDHVMEVYASILGKYFKPVINVYENATQKAQERFNVIKEAVTESKGLSEALWH